MINAKRSCIAPNLNCKSFVKTTYCKHGVVVICQLDSHGPGSTAAFFFSTALCQGFGSSFDPHWHERLDSWIRKHLLAAWLPVMALHEANQARSSHYLQWHCGLKLHLLVTNDILHLLGKHSTTSPQRAHRHQSGQSCDVLPRYRLVPCKQLSRLRNKERRVHSWSNPNQYSCAPRLGYFGCTRSTVNFAKLVNDTSKLMTIQSSSLCGVQCQQLVRSLWPEGTPQSCWSWGTDSRDWVAKHKRTTCKSVWNCSSKTGGARRHSEKKTILKHFLKGLLKGKLLATKLRKSADKSLSQPWCSHSNTIYEIQLRKDKSITHAAAAPSKLDAVITMRFAASHRKPARIYAHGNSRWQSCSHSNAIRNRRFNTRIELRTATRCRTQRRNTFATETTPAATAAHTRYLSSPPATTLHRKIQGFVLRLPPQNKAHATFMQPLQCILQHHVANLHLYTHGNTRWQQSCRHSNAIRNRRFNTRIELRTQEQPLVAEHRGGTSSRQKRPQPQPPHSRGTFHRRLQPLYTEKYKVSCSGFLPKTKPMQHSCRFMQPLQCILQHHVANLHLYTHGNTRWQQSCSHSTGIWNHRFNTRIELRTATRCRTQRRNTFATETTPAATAAHTRYLSSPAATTLHRKMQGFVLRLPPQNKAHATFMQIHAAITMHFAASRGKPASLHTWQHQMTTIVQRFQCDPQPQIQHTHRTTHAGTTTRCRTQRRNTFATETTPAATAALTRYLSSPAATTLHRKIQGFVLRLPPQHKPRATFMQPLHCVLQHHVANPNLSSHMATPDDNNHAAITRVYCYVMSSLTPQSHTALHWVYCYR